MTQITYRIVEHDGGWAYKVGDSFSETFPNAGSARTAAARAAREQRVADKTAWIEFETPAGEWVTERADGHDRPDTAVEG